MEGLMAREEEFLLLPGMKSTHFTDWITAPLST
jgi:hypothetical protein